MQEAHLISNHLILPEALWEGDFKLSNFPKLRQAQELPSFVLCIFLMRRKHFQIFFSTAINKQVIVLLLPFIGFDF
jgi:hypothetical protein